MYEDNTTFVIGAGASQEFGLPVGWDLLTQIRDNSFFLFDGGAYPSRGARAIYEAVYGKHQDDPEMIKRIFQGFVDIHRRVVTAESIDEYINRHSDDAVIAEISKLQIAFAIMHAEVNSNLVPHAGSLADGVNWDNADSSWIGPFARKLFEGVRASEVETIGSNISIICFNYDRCIEHYLEYAIQRAYRDVDRKLARQIVKSMNIIHPYGSLGDISRVAFGTPLEHVDLYHVTKSLITWSESIQEDNLVEDIHEAIRDARNIVFMGFAFANQNMRLLNASVDDAKSYFTKVYATGYGLTPDVERKLKKQITALYANNSEDPRYHNWINIKYGMKCAEFFKTQHLNFMM
ncbi:hypothetical protein CO657_26275 (plasmid) [Rhizobium acidisoli]|uniref:SIR2-like domain-containing protein n=1 Tax=Rhizobium acidisoli TaxID=1538158 RepID=A0AAE6C2K3_9HYPH|nr:SIR2 family protein [Rhizobium acidisoli]KPH04533.1 hypothetical protein AOG23_32805 [Rhizobium acidisoli]QAS81418.1 hypothetical protein CO657_26275 [Rhizobium acidisoli]